MFMLIFIWQCSRKCGHGLKKRTVLCTSSNPGAHTQTLPDSECAGLQKPATQESCFIKRCQKQRKVQWFVSTWQEVMQHMKRMERNVECAKHYCMCARAVLILCWYGLSMFSVQLHVVGVIRDASSSVLKRCVGYRICSGCNKILIDNFRFTCCEDYRFSL